MNTVNIFKKLLAHEQINTDVILLLIRNSDEGKITFILYVLSRWIIFKIDRSKIINLIELIFLYDTTIDVTALIIAIMYNGVLNAGHNFDVSIMLLLIESNVEINYYLITQCDRYSRCVIKNIVDKIISNQV